MQLKVKDFASEMGVSESIVYRHIRQHREDLGDRVIKKAKATWITDEGQQYLRNLMIQHEPSVVLRDHPDWTELNEKIKTLEASAQKQAEAHAAVVKMLAEERERADQLAVQAAKVQLLEAAAADREKSLAEAQEKAAKALAEADVIRKALEEEQAKVAAMKGRNLIERIMRKGE